MCYTWPRNLHIEEALKVSQLATAGRYNSVGAISVPKQNRGSSFERRAKHAKREETAGSKAFRAQVPISTNKRSRERDLLTIDVRVLVRMHCELSPALDLYLGAGRISGYKPSMPTSKNTYRMLKIKLSSTYSAG
jgi:hypothetical protein